MCINIQPGVSLANNNMSSLILACKKVLMNKTERVALVAGKRKTVPHFPDESIEDFLVDLEVVQSNYSGSIKELIGEILNRKSLWRDWHAGHLKWDLFNEQVLALMKLCSPEQQPTQDPPAEK